MTIPEIKSRLTLAQVLSYYQLKPDKHMRLHCPFHEDKTPSFQVYYKTHTCYCFSSNCKTHGKSMDVIDFIMHMENKDSVISTPDAKHKAIQKAQELLGMQPATTFDAGSGTSTLHYQPLMQITQATISRHEILQNMFTYFKNAVHNSKPARDYITGRGLDPVQSEIGYNSAQFHHGARKEQTLISNCVSVGLLVPWGVNNRSPETQAYKPFAKYCICFALRNKSNQINGLYFRSTENNTNQKHYYLKESSGLYPAYPPPETRKLIIAECIIDTATLQQIPELTKHYTLLSAYGTNRLNEEHINAIKELPQLEEIIFFFDGDEAGNKAVEKYTAQLHALLPALNISKVNTPEEEDINSLYCKYDAELIIKLIGERSVVQEKNVLSKAEVAQAPTIAEGKYFNTENPEALVWQNEWLNIMLLGGIKLTGLDRLKVTLKIKSLHNHYLPLRHNLDLYNTEQAQRLKHHVAEQLEHSLAQVETSFNQLIEDIENYRLQRIGAALQTRTPIQALTPQQTEESIHYLKDPNLMSNTLTDTGKTGIVGEPCNRFVMYLVFLSRLTEEPLHIISFGASGTGKTYLQESVAKLVPDEDKLEVTALSGNALYYFKNEDLKHKLLLIEDYDGVQEGLYPLRELSTKQKITKRIPLKDSRGNIKTHTFSVEGPVSIAGCTTKDSVYEDNANRSILIYLDTSTEQDERIMEYQRAVSAGLINHAQEEHYQHLLRNVQRMIKPIRVINPYAPCLKIPRDVLKPRRSHRLYLRFIEIVTLYNQYQREIKTHPQSGNTYIETTIDDIAWANKLLKDILLRKADELTTASRIFLERLKNHLKKNNTSTFKAREIRKELRIHASSLKKYLLELNTNGYIKISGGTKARGYLYEVSSYEEYEMLKSGISNVLDDLLEKIKQNGCKGVEETNSNTSGKE